MPVPDPQAYAIERTLRNPRVMLGVGALLLVAPPILLFTVWLLFSWAIIPVLSSQFWFSIIMMALSLFIIIHLCAACILAERKLSAFIQDRKGPDRVGWGGVLQPVADGVKFLLKEEIIPRNVDRPIYLLAPCIAFCVALLGFAVIPWAGEIVWPWTDANGEPIKVSTQVASLDAGILYVLAVGSLGVYAVVLAGWASNSKYAHYGGMRATAQMLSYEVPLGLGVLALLLLAGTLRLEEMVNVQAQTGIWYVFVLPLPFLLVLIAAFAETNRAPFDLAECEQELVAGFHSEYSAMKFALFYLGEYSHMITNSAVMTALFFGGWAPLPFLSWYSTDATGGVDHTWWNTSWIAALIKFHIFWGKICLFIAFYMIIRWTLPRFRFDQLMKLGWKWLVPLGMVMVFATGALVAFGWVIDPNAPALQNWLAAGMHLALNAIVFAAAMWMSQRSGVAVTGRQDNLPAVAIGR